MHGVLIAGTNGKGSVAAMVASMCQAAGLRTSQAPSPHLSSYRERILIDSQPISSSHLDSMLEEVLAASAYGQAQHGPATEFELLTAAAFLWSARVHVDVAIIEVGLGGRLDASNTWDADVAAITSIGLDHREFLGDTIEAVAREKAAIIKRGSRAVTTATGAALQVVERRARRLDVPLAVCEPLAIERMDLAGMTIKHERLGQLHLSLVGRYQATNAAAALGIVAALGEAGVAQIDDAAMIRGLAETRWPGRLEVLHHEGLVVVLDGAHNPAGALALAASIDELAEALPRGRATLLLGVMADKDVPDILESLARSCLLADARFVACGVPNTDRALPAEALAAAWSAMPGTRPAAVWHDRSQAALDEALELAHESGGPLIVAGSLYLIGDVRPRLRPASVLV